MFKKTSLFLVAFILTVYAFSQDVKKEAKNAETKMEAFASKTGTIYAVVGVE
jgi:hypothetical protein